MVKSRAKRAVNGMICTIIGWGVLSGTSSWSAPVDVFKQDDFEDKTLGHSKTQWSLKELYKSTLRNPPHAYDSGRVDVAPADAQNGNQSLRVEWRESDVVPGSNPSRHAEIKTTPFAWSSPLDSPATPKLEQWLGFRIYIDSQTLGPSAKPVVLMQYHDLPDADEGYRNPIVALSYVNGRFEYGWKGDSKTVTPKVDGKWIYTQSGGMDLGAARIGNAVNRSGWNTFVFHHKFDPFGQGSVEIWCNDTYISRQNIQLGYNDKIGPYLKIGFYWYKANQPVPDAAPRVAWFDDIKLGNGQATYLDVRPTGASATAPIAAVTKTAG